MTRVRLRVGLGVLRRRIRRRHPRPLSRAARARTGSVAASIMPIAAAAEAVKIARKRMSFLADSREQRTIRGFGSWQQVVCPRGAPQGPAKPILRCKLTTRAGALTSATPPRGRNHGETGMKAWLRFCRGSWLLPAPCSASRIWRRDPVQEAVSRALSARRVPQTSRLTGPGCSRSSAMSRSTNSGAGSARRSTEDASVDLWRFDDACIAKITVEQGLSMLSSQHREIIALIDIAGFGYGEAADMLQVPVGTVMSRITRRAPALLAAIEQSTVRPLKSRPWPLTKPDDLEQLNALVDGELPPADRAAIAARIAAEPRSRSRPRHARPAEGRASGVMPMPSRRLASNARRKTRRPRPRRCGVRCRGNSCRRRVCRCGFAGPSPHSRGRTCGSAGRCRPRSSWRSPIFRRPGSHCSGWRRMAGGRSSG